DGEIILDTNNEAADHSAFEGVATADGLIEQSGEIFHSHGVTNPFSIFYPACRLVPAVF
ncbi:MAG: hypothetical protein H7Z12_08785, partial [Rhodospirillaceae bacterium]|nr:hypothetical protein [Rhodospirillales bacterium]